MLKGKYHTESEIVNSFNKQEIRRLKLITDLSRYSFTWRETEKSKLIKWSIIGFVFLINLFACLINIYINAESLIWLTNFIFLIFIIESNTVQQYEKFSSTYEVWPIRK